MSLKIVSPHATQSILDHPHAVWDTQHFWNFLAFNERHTHLCRMSICPNIFKDIALFSRSLQINVCHVCNVLTLSENEGAIVRLEMCRVFSKRIDFFGLFTRSRSNKMATHTKKTISIPQASINLTDFQFFLRFCKVFERLGPNV